MDARGAGLSFLAGDERAGAIDQDASWDAAEGAERVSQPSRRSS
jgi:hypothetical protein